MARYIDGFVLPIPKDRVDDYKKLAERASAIWKEHGALDYWECLGDDLQIPDMVSFLQIMNASEDETVVFAWVVFESREHRDRANEKIMSDPRLQEMMQNDKPIFDYKRMAYGGFKELVHR